MEVLRTCPEKISFGSFLFEKKMNKFSLFFLKNKLRMKHFFFLLFLLLGAGSADLSAQTTWSTVSDDQYASDICQKLSIDTTLPDYSVYKVDPQVMGPRLASILQELGAKYKRSDYLSILSMIQAEQITFTI